MFVDGLLALCLRFVVCRLLLIVSDCFAVCMFVWGGAGGGLVLMCVDVFFGFFFFEFVDCC